MKCTSLFRLASSPHFLRSVQCNNKFGRIPNVFYQVRHLSSQPFDHEQKYKQVLQACRLGDKEQVKQIIEEGKQNGANFFREKEFTPLHIAAEIGNTNLTSTLIDLGCHVDIYSSTQATPLYIAAGSGKVEVVRLLLERGAYLEAVTKNGNTSLHNASRTGYVEVVDYLIRGAANIHCKTADGTTPIHYACTGGHVKVIKRLLEADPKLIESKLESTNWTPLLAAVSYNQKEVVSFLLDKGANLEATDNLKYTGLMIACEQNFADIAELLIKRGANVNASNSAATPMILAGFVGSKQILDALKQAGASDKLPQGMKHIMQDGKVVGVYAGPDKK